MIEKPPVVWNQNESTAQHQSMTRQRDADLKWFVKWLQLHGGHCPIYYAQGREARFDIPWDEWQELKKLARGH